MTVGTPQTDGFGFPIDDPATPVADPAQPPPHFRALLWVCVVLAAIWQVWLGLTRGLNADELQMLSAATGTLRGQQLYTDTWDNHGPAVTWLLAGLLYLFEGRDYGVLVPLRLVFLGFFALTCGVFVLWIKALRGRRELAPMALLCLLCSPFLTEKIFELRGDSVMMILWVTVLWMWTWAVRRQSLWLHFGAGVVLGLAFWFSIKTLILGFSVGLMFAGLMIARRRLDPLPILAFGVGTLVGPITLWWRLSSDGLFDDFWRLYVSKSFDRERPGIFDGFNSMYEFAPVGTALLVLALVVTGFSLRHRRTIRLPLELRLLWPAGMFLIFQFLFLIPTHHLQTLLPAIFPVSILMAWVILEAIPPFFHRRRDRWWSALLGPKSRHLALGLLFAGLMYKSIETSLTLQQYIHFGNELLRAIPPTARAADAHGHPLFRENPLWIKSMVKTLVDRIRAEHPEHLPFDFAKELADNDVEYLVYSRRLGRLGEETREQLRQRYIPLGPLRLMAAGTAFQTENTGDNDRDLHVHVSGLYHWGIDAGIENLRIDGQYPPNPVRLEDGVYKLSWKGSGRVVFCVAPPEYWSLDFAIGVREPLPASIDYGQSLRRWWWLEEEEGSLASLDALTSE